MYTKKNKSMRTVQQDKKSTGFFYCNLDNNNKNQMNGSAIFFCKKKQSAFLRCWTIHSFSLNLFNAVLLTLCFGFASCFTFYFLCCTSCFSHSFLSCSVCNLACAEFYGSDELSHPLLHLIDINRVRALAIIKLSSKLKWCVCVRFFAPSARITITISLPRPLAVVNANYIFPIFILRSPRACAWNFSFFPWKCNTME